jgi:hypothetical protein
MKRLYKADIFSEDKKMLKKILMLTSIVILGLVMNALSAGGDLIMKLETKDGTSGVQVKDSDGVIVSSTTSKGEMQVSSATYLATSGGKVGIGTINPSEKLEVYNGNIKTNYGINAVTGTFIGTGSSVVGLQVSSSAYLATSGGRVGIGTSSPTGLFQVGGGSLTVLSSGNIGIGTITPSEKLEVYNGNIKTNYGVNAVTGTFTGTGSLIVGLQVSSSAYIATSGGRVGIGTTSPGTLLHTYLPGSGEAIRLQGNSTTIQTYMTFFATTTRMGYIGTNPASLGNGVVVNADIGGIMFQTAGDDAHRAVLTSGGRVGIGTTSPGAKLDVNTTGEAIRLTGVTSQIYQSFYKDTYNRIGYIGTSASGDDIVLNADTPNGIILRTNNVARMYVSDAGNVGIGTTIPTELLNIYSNSDHAKLYVNCESATKSAQVYIRNNGGGADENLTFYVFGSSYGAGGYFGTGSYSKRAVIVSNNLTDFELGTADSAPLILGTNNSERMRISEGGYVGIGTTNPQSKLDVRGDVYIGGPTTNAENGTPTGNLYVYLNTGGNWTSSGVTDGKTSYHRLDREDVNYDNAKLHYFAISDCRLKKDIKPYKFSFDKLNQLRPVNFNWNDKGLRYATRNIEKDYVSGTGDKKKDKELWDSIRKNENKQLQQQQFGLIAQDVEKVFPDWVIERDGYKQISTEKLSIFVLSAVQEQQKEIESLKKEIEELKKKIK